MYWTTHGKSGAKVTKGKITAAKQDLYVAVFHKHKHIYPEWALWCSCLAVKNARHVMPLLMRKEHLTSHENVLFFKTPGDCERFMLSLDKRGDTNHRDWEAVPVCEALLVMVASF